MGTHSLLGEGPFDRAPYDQREGRDDHDCTGFCEAIKYRRCLVHADCFYEWQRLNAKTKQPFAIAMKDGKPYALAGLWERWKDRKAGTELLTFTVITTDPNEVIEQLHDRMPCIIPEKDYDRWLQPGDPDRPPIDLLRPFDGDKMTAWKVTLS